MGFLLDLPTATRGPTLAGSAFPSRGKAMALGSMAQAVHDYTGDAITKLIAGGARPDMVQIGNEITPGMLINICGNNGRPPAPTTSTEARRAGATWERSSRPEATR